MTKVACEIDKTTYKLDKMTEKLS